MTETGAGAVICANQLPRRVGESCLGKPGPELEVRIVDTAGYVSKSGPGELLVRREAGTRVAGSSQAISRTLKPPMRPGPTAGFIPATSSPRS
jgi:acyl-coenzyme A synthetase/AMP-(fatty) acid ligase